jgi:hypothetical protein
VFRNHGPESAVAILDCDQSSVQVTDRGEGACYATINALHSRGYTRLSPDLVGAALSDCRPQEWLEFKESWNHLAVDNWMADGGRYRRRSFAVFRVGPDAIVREVHQPHFQERLNNPLNGGVDRWFAPTSNEVAGGTVLRTLLRAVTGIIEWGTGSRLWHVEVHQFRITAGVGQVGSPTPEGVHRDGVDWVFMMFIDRFGVSGGETEIHSIDGEFIDRFTLKQPLEAVCLNDKRLLHGATPIACLPSCSEGYRDVLVVTWVEDRSNNS